MPAQSRWVLVWKPLTWPGLHCIAILVKIKASEIVIDVIPKGEEL